MGRDGEENQELRHLETIKAMNLSSPGFLSQTYPDIFVRNDVSEVSTTL